MGIPPRPLMGSHRLPTAPAVPARPGAPPPVPPRPAGMMLPIAAGQIKSIDEMVGGMNPVWLVTMTNTPKKFVVKSEKAMSSDHGVLPNAQQVANIKAMNSIMGVVSAKTDMLALSAPELTALGSFSNSPQSMKDALQKVNSKQSILVKMYQDASFTSTPNKAVLDDGGFPENIMTDNDRMKSRSMFNKLRGNRAAWQSLGQVAIADALIGNSDRLTLSPPGVTNFGNLIFSTNAQGDIIHALGYDTIDPFTGNPKLLHGQDIREWISSFGAHILSKTKFTAIAMGVMSDIKRHRLDPLQMAPYTDGEAQALSEGLSMGWDKQAMWISSTVQSGKGIPSGLMARAKYLGWVR